MKTCLSYLISLVLSTATVTVAQALDDAVAVAPEHYHVVFQNDHVRVYELLASTGARSPMHVQPPGVLVSLEKARFEMAAPDGTSAIVDFNPGQISWMERTERAWRLLAGRAHAFFVEVNSAATGEVPTPVPLDAKDSVVVDPVRHHVVLENNHVRVFDGMAAPGDESPPHSHPPTVLISLSKSRFKVTIDDVTRIFDFDPARVYWVGNFEHYWTVLTGHAHVVGIEIKSARLPVGKSSAEND